MNPLNVTIDPMGQWHLCIFFGVAAIITALCYKYRRFSGIVPALFAWYFSLRFAVGSIFPKDLYGAWSVAFRSEAGATALEAVAVVAGVVVFRSHIKKLIPVLVLFSITATLFDSAGLMGTISFNMALMALCLPYVRYMRIPVSLLILWNHGTTALLMLSARIFTKNRKKVNGLTMAVFFAIAAFAILLFKKDLWIGAPSRIGFYKQYMPFLLNSWDYLIFGVGPGSFRIIGPAMAGYKEDMPIFLNSDWLQMLWEYGVIGFGLCVALVIVAWGKTRGNVSEQAKIAGAVVFALTYGPLRFFPSALVMALIFADVLLEKVHEKRSGCVGPGVPLNPDALPLLEFDGKNDVRRTSGDKKLSGLCGGASCSDQNAVGSTVGYEDRVRGVCQVLKNKLITRGIEVVISERLAEQPTYSRIRVRGLRGSKSTNRNSQHDEH